MPDGSAALAHERVHQIFADRFGFAQRAVFAQRAKQRSFLDAARFQPAVDELFDPARNGHGTNPSALPAEVELHPALFPQLQMKHFEPHEFVTAQAASNEQRENRAIAHAQARGGIGNAE